MTLGSTTLPLQGAEVAQGDPFFDMVLKNLPEGVGPDVSGCAVHACSCMERAP